MKITDVLEYKNLFTHCSLIGTTGSGKTTYMLAIIKNIILNKNYNQIIFIDGKNDNSLKDKLENLSKLYQYDFYVFGNGNLKSNFDYSCFKNKKYSEIKEIIFKLRTKEINNVSLGANYYLNLSNNLIFLIIKLLMDKNIIINWKNLELYCNKNKLKEIITDEYKDEFYSYSKDVFQDALIFIQSYSEYFDNNAKNSYSLCDLISKNKKSIILFSLDFLTFPTLSKDIAQSICLDLRQSIKYKKLDLFCFLDEFGSYINQDLKTILEQGRSHRTSLILSYQSLAQINKDNFKNIVFDNTNNWFIFNMKHEQSLKEISNLFGYTKTLNINYTIDLTLDNLYSNKGGVSSVDTLYVSPDEIKFLRPLECFIRTVKKPRYFSKNIED